MQRVSFYSAILRNVADAATSPAPVASTEAAPAAKPVRKLVTRSNKPAKPEAAAKPGKPSAPVVVKAKPGAKPATSAKPAAAIVRTAATIHRGACNFGGLSDRDSAYVTFYSSLAKRAQGGVVTISAIVDSGKRPNWPTSNKPHDAGVIQRLAKAGLVSLRDNGNAFSFTKAAHTHAAYVAGQR